MRALLAVVLIAVAAPETSGIQPTREGAVSACPSLNPAERRRQSPRLTPRPSARPLSLHQDGVILGSSCPSAAQDLLARLPSRGEANKGLQQLRGGEKNRESLPRSTTPSAVHKSVAGNLAAWTVILGAALICSRTKLKDEEGARYMTQHLDILLAHLYTYVL